ncbi:MAG TPA: hypothetical protein VH590_03640, partial [Ktedonobacterales bacterium]
ETGNLLHTLPGHEEMVRGVTFSANGSVLVSAGYDGTVRLWQPQTARCLAVLDSFSGGVNAVAFTPGDASLAIAANDPAIQLWHSADLPL